LGAQKRFQERYERPIEDGRDRTASEWTIKTAEKANTKLQELLRPYFLQRMKRDVFQSILPPKSDLIVWTHMSEKQRSMYEDYVQNGNSVASLLAGVTSSPLEAITWLKKLCCHPSLVPRNEESLRKFDIMELTHDSAKLQVMVDLVERLQWSGHRMLIFSQSTRMLDIIERVLNSMKVLTLRIDGSTKEKDRQRFVDQFNADNSTVGVMLLSTKAGGLGLTLTGADRVIIFDPSWNPADDAQAVDRSYRIGQRNPVTVYRLITAGTVEEKMYEKQVYKDGIRRTVVETSGSNTARYFTPSELSEVFKLGPEGECSFLDKMNTDMENRPEAAIGSSGKPSFLSEHPSVIGITSHDDVYSSKSNESNNPSAAPFATPQPKQKVVGRSQRVLMKKNVLQAENQPVPVDALPTVYTVDSSEQFEALKDEKLLRSLQDCLDVLENDSVQGQEKISLHQKIAKVSHDLGWLK